ncbi:MAG: NADP-dependent malic enzyme [Alphaproteobacteria bacterium]|nr:NADP-dependent malic enzyme [Alphaproteobacteria bacterium]
MADDKLRESALEYHRHPTAGKLAIVATKPLANQRDLALAYSPGVAFACQAIVENPAEAARLTARGNLVAVITNGTAVLGLGAIGPLAGKPVMEGKAVLFKKFADIDVFDIEIAERDPDKLVDIIASLEPTFGGINLEDIKAPECFEIEARLRTRLKIPVFHDDQHGTAIIVSAAILNALRVVGKPIGEIKLVTSGAGAAALACLDLLVDLGVKRENIWVTDIAGVVYEGRKEEMDPRKARYARPTAARSLGEVIVGADVFLGLSAPRVLKPEWVRTMADRPIVMALANPTPEIMPEEVRAARPDAIIATGRSDYPNQVNNVLCFPFIFRGALDVGATAINEAMKIAAVRAIADLATKAADEQVAAAYGGEPPAFGPDNLIPKPFDPRLIFEIAPAVAKAAMDSGVATRPIADLEAYRQRLSEFVYRSGFLMRPIFERAKQRPMRIVFADGEDERVLRAVQTVIDERLAVPILVGRRETIRKRIDRLGLRLQLDRDVELRNPEDLPHYQRDWNFYHRRMARQGVSVDGARTIVRTRNTVIAALMVAQGEADGMICGIIGRWHRALRDVIDVIGLAPEVEVPAAVTALIMPRGTIFVTDTHVSPDPAAPEVAAMTARAADVMKRFGIKPRAALLSHSTYGSFDTESSAKMRSALGYVRALAPDLEIDGEMDAEAAFDEAIRRQALQDPSLRGEANLLVMPTLDAAHIAFGLLRQLGGGQRVGPILLGMAAPAHVLDNSSTVRGIINMTALCAVEAQDSAAARG